MTTDIRTSEANEQKLKLALRVWQTLLADALRRGFNGTAAIEIIVQDGTIQLVRRRVEQVEK